MSLDIVNMDNTWSVFTNLPSQHSSPRDDPSFSFTLPPPCNKPFQTLYQPIQMSFLVFSLYPSFKSFREIASDRGWRVVGHGSVIVGYGPSGQMGVGVDQMRKAVGRHRVRWIGP